MDLSYKSFCSRHIGASEEEISFMLNKLGYKDIDTFIDAVIPDEIRLSNKEEISLNHLAKPLDENKTLEIFKKETSKNKIYTTYIGQGFYPSYMPGVIQRNILNNPSWYTSYTPYQAEISQGRLEALMNFQTLICELTGMDASNASLLDEASACAESMRMAQSLSPKKKPNKILIYSKCHPQNIQVIKSHADPLNIEILLFDKIDIDLSEEYNMDEIFGILIQNPNTLGEINNFKKIIQSAKVNNIIIIMAIDLLAQTLLKSPKTLGADIVIGSSGRFGLPLWYGGPHAAFISCLDSHKRKLPGRIIGLSKDKHDKPSFRLSLQTREQHIRREKATSNICTAQSLPAILASMYAVYHGKEGLTQISKRVNKIASHFQKFLSKLNYKIITENIFDTISLEIPSKNELKKILQKAQKEKVEFRILENSKKIIISIAFDETKGKDDLDSLARIFSNETKFTTPKEKHSTIKKEFLRTDDFLHQEVFNKYHSETNFMRYIKNLEKKDYSLCDGMIPLGSCTMKLNAASELIPVSWEGTAHVHPYTRRKQPGYDYIINTLSKSISKITQLPHVSLQPNAGSQGELAGLLAIRSYYRSKNKHNRNICFIPESAHGTNPASAVLAGMKVIVIKCNDNGDVSLEDLKEKCKEFSDSLAVLMITYPSTHGVFETEIQTICKTIHSHGGQVYMDGANMNAQIGYTSPGKLGADVCHLNLHKTFAIPHGGGGPGVGPIAVAEHLKKFLPGQPNQKVYFKKHIKNNNAICATQHGSAGILPISWMYISMMGAEGLKKATSIAILNANFIAKKLEKYYPILFTGKNNLCAHECIIDCRDLNKKYGITVEDICKRLCDYSLHAPTMSWPIPGTLMIEPTESESLDEINRLCDALISIHSEIISSKDNKNNILKNAPHTFADLTKEDWDYPYSREQAVFPKDTLKSNKFWISVNRIDNAFGDRNLICSCDPVSFYKNNT